MCIEVACLEASIPFSIHPCDFASSGGGGSLGILNFRAASTCECESLKRFLVVFACMLWRDDDQQKGSSVGGDRLGECRHLRRSGAAPRERRKHRYTKQARVPIKRRAPGVLGTPPTPSARFDR